VLIACEYSGRVRDAFLSAGHDALSCDLHAGRRAVVHLAPPGPNRWRDRSRTYPGIAAAMADQWGALPALVPA
jgi:hypothetical protein